MFYKTTTETDFPELITHFTYYNSYFGGLGACIFNIFTENSCYALNGYYNQLAQNNDMFVVERSEFNIKDISRTFNHITILNSDGYLQQTSEDDYSYSYTFVTHDLSEYKASVFRALPRNRRSNYVYDEIGNRFLSTDPGGLVLKPVESDETLINFDDVGEYDALYMDCGYDVVGGSSSDTYVITVLKSETAPNYYAYIFDAYRGHNDNQKIVDLSNCTDISLASGFATSSLETILYYAVDNKVYSVSLDGGSAPVSYLAYETPEPGDKITSIEMWITNYTYESTSVYTTDINDPTGDPLLVTAHGRMILMSTYNEASQEGKVICVPIQIFNSPQYGLEANESYHRVFEGFGRILDMDHILPRSQR